MEKKSQNMFDKIMGIYTLVVLCAFPIVYDDFYFNILETKYKFYCACVIVMLVILLVYGLYSGHLIDFFVKIKKRNPIKHIKPVDWALIVFWFSYVASWINCKWPWEAFWGTSGRYNGVFLITLYAIAYFTTTRFLKLKRVYLDAFLLVSIFVCMFGISDYFQMDLLGFKELMLDKQKVIYTSTIGNINTYTVYVGAVLGVSMMLFILESCKVRTVYYFGIMVMSMVALIVGTSDNAYLTLAVLFGLSPLYLFRKKTWIRRYVTSVAIFFTVIVFVGWLSRTYAEVVYELDSIFKILVKVSVLPYIAAGLWAVVAVMTFFAKRKNESYTDELGKGLTVAWIGIIAAVIFVIAFIFYDANVAGNAEKYNAIKNYVVYNENWGTNRGYVWNSSIELYKNILTPVQKLFGYGADTFKLLMTQYYGAKNGFVYDSAHNEYIHFLITIGFVGVMSYIAVFVTSVMTMAKRLKDRPEVAAILFVVIAYAVQAIVNINVPVVFPLIFQLLAMGLSEEPLENEE